MSDQFDSLVAIERADTEAAVDRCRSLAAQVASELRNKRPTHFVDKLSLADFYDRLRSIPVTPVGLCWTTAWR
jgi:hypothetical protein